MAWTEKLLVPVFLSSTLFMIMFSNDAVNYWVYVCMVVQMGSFFAIAYLYLLFHLLKRLSGFYKRAKNNRTPIKLLAILFIGFFIQSLTVDTLMYPDINFLFHSLLGAVANLEKT